jgi:hypothetical protein
MNPTHDQDKTIPQTVSRRWDRQPETEADRRFFDLRESGYTGWIDQDGYPVTDVDAWLNQARTRHDATPGQVVSDGSHGYVVTDAGLRMLADAEATPGEAPGTAPQVLRSAALYLERHGWIQGAYYDSTSAGFTPPACLVGAIGMVCYGGPCEAPAQHFDDPGFLDFEQAVLHLDRYLLVEDGSESYAFNDATGRRVEDVTHVLRDAASRPAEELIDAIRAIDAHNADMAALAWSLTPGGVWGNRAETPNPVEHVDYPHTPGTLYDCPACEAACFCTDGFQCVHCALAAEQAGRGGSTPGGAE